MWAASGQRTQPVEIFDTLRLLNDTVLKPEAYSSPPPYCGAVKQGEQSVGQTLLTTAPALVCMVVTLLTTPAAPWRGIAWCGIARTPDDEMLDADRLFNITVPEANSSPPPCNAIKQGTGQTAAANAPPPWEGQSTVGAAGRCTLPLDKLDAQRLINVTICWGLSQWSSPPYCDAIKQGTRSVGQTNTQHGGAACD